MQIETDSRQKRLTREDYARAERALPWNQAKLVFNDDVRPVWIAGTDRFWYRVNRRNGNEFMLVDPARGTREPAFDHARLAAGLSLASGIPFVAERLPFDQIAFLGGGRSIGFRFQGCNWTADLSTYRCERGAAIEMPRPEVPSPDGRWVAFRRQHDLWVRDCTSGAETRLTDDGEPEYDYGGRPDANNSPITSRLAGERPPLVLWSPDSRRLVTNRLDHRKVGELHLLQSCPPAGLRPVLHTFRAPLPGDAEVIQCELFLFDVESGARTAVQYQASPITFASPLELQFVWWSDDGEVLYYIFQERACKALHLLAVDPMTGSVRRILEERGATYVEATPFFGARPNVRILKSGEVLWYSERDGWAHLYLCDGQTGEVRNPVTSGPWAVRAILHVDESRRQLYFTAGGREPGRDPYYLHAYRVNLDGSGLTLLTPEDAEHEVSFAPDGRHFVDLFSRVDAAPRSLLRTSEGALVCELEQADVSALLETGWTWPEPFRAKARDGVTDIYGAIYRPSHFTPDGAYPVIDSIYPGPQVIRTSKSFCTILPNDCQPLAELGAIVVTVDGLGTPLRSKAFHDYSYGRMGDAGGLEDHIAAIRQLALRYPYMDLERVGIYGHSAGGYATQRAMLLHPDFYRVGVASAGAPDQGAYLASWGEKYQGMPSGDNYREQDNLVHAGNLKGKLLLVHGDMDDNVLPSLMMRLVDALVKANKDFDLLLLPNRNHMSFYDVYYFRRLWDYFAQYLIGAVPPADYRIGEMDLAMLARWVRPNP